MALRQKPDHLHVARLDWIGAAPETLLQIRNAQVIRDARRGTALHQGNQAKPISARGEFASVESISRISYDSPGKAEDSAFLRGVVNAFPYQIRRVLTDNGVAFTKNTSTRYDMIQHPFDRVCDENGIEHRLTKPYHPWINGQAERMNRTVKEATTKTFHYDTAETLCAHVLTFIAAYNFAKHLKALKWKTPFQTICSAWTANPTVFKINPHHLIPGPYT